jgi:hypothetical protein
MKKNLTWKINLENFLDLLEKLQELSIIDDTIKFKIEKDNFLIYSILGNEGQVSAMKCYIKPTKFYIENFDETDSYEFVLTSSSKFVKNLKFFDVKRPIKMEISAKKLPDDDNIFQIRSIHFSNGKLKISSIGAELHKIKDLTKTFIDNKLDVKKSRWKFIVQNEDFTNIKKLSTINSEDRILNINVSNNKVYFNEISKWELEVDDIQLPNQNFMFSKKYLSFINTDNENIVFNIFDNFILIKDEDSNLMLSFEQDFSNDN